jgi:transposase-like protein
MENEIKRTIDSLTKEYCLEEKENQKTNLLNIILIKIKNDNTIFADLIKNIREYISSSKDLIRQSALTLILRILERVANLKMEFSFYKNLIDLGFNKMKDVVLSGNAVKIIYSKN